MPQVFRDSGCREREGRHTELGLGHLEGGDEGQGVGAEAANDHADINLVGGRSRNSIR